MKKFTAIIGIIFIYFLTFSPNVFAKENIKTDVYSEFVITLLGPELAGVVNEYYGEPRQFDLDNTKIVNVKKIEEGSLYFVVTVKVRTFYKAPNYRYGIDIVTLTNTNEGIQIMDFVHEDEPISNSL